MLLAELREVLTRDHLARRLAKQQTTIEDAIHLLNAFLTKKRLESIMSNTA